MKQKNITARQIKNLLNALKNNSAIAEKLNSPTDSEKSIKWFENNLGIKCVEKNLKVSLPTKGGVKEYSGVKFDNGKIAVFIKGGSVLKYAWK